MNIKLKLWILILLPSNKRNVQSNFGWHILDYLTKALYDLKNSESLLHVYKLLEWIQGFGYPQHTRQLLTADIWQL